MRSRLVAGLVVVGCVLACGSTQPAPLDCNTPSVSSSLPGVHFDLTGNRCSYTLAEAAAGVQLHYAVVVDANVAGVQSSPASPASCAGPDASGLVVEPSIDGGGQGYCMCDCGLGTGAPTTSNLTAGTYAGSFAWDGKNWAGPSDTNNPEGAAFPAGSYSFTVRVGGVVSGVPFTMTGSVKLDLTP